MRRRTHTDICARTHLDASADSHSPGSSADTCPRADCHPFAGTDYANTCSCNRDASANTSSSGSAGTHFNTGSTHTQSYCNSCSSSPFTCGSERANSSECDRT